MLDPKRALESTWRKGGPISLWLLGCATVDLRPYTAWSYSFSHILQPRRSRLYTSRLQPYSVVLHHLTRVDALSAVRWCGTLYCIAGGCVLESASLGGSLRYSHVHIPSSLGVSASCRRARKVNARTPHIARRLSSCTSAV
ncbi:hypothetical protein PLICRDRAFT_454532 [Plicaturopsis crispa FD-325 SS-3]|uniref:Unplaced genomic scaffold PLICRscaffold_26, whole genome shotgun sequence n=1 Tax=Plicaturopsis crispa FD-325 SS-3 TaxID=944288 RepID=A0A0C9SK87_PLICR|nr:hypothetical protein PLICRDRAFT_454532 [Plicaturopsis crispa FD-325 SS-3]